MFSFSLLSVFFCPKLARQKHEKKEREHRWLEEEASTTH
jgi:hypothetical protein